MVRLLIRKGMAAELARIPQYIDLSGPEFTSTMNAVLKPLETLTRIMSQPPPHTKNRGEKGDKDAANKTQVATRTDGKQHLIGIFIFISVLLYEIHYNSEILSFLHRHHAIFTRLLAQNTR